MTWGRKCSRCGIGLAGNPNGDLCDRCIDLLAEEQLDREPSVEDQAAAADDYERAALGWYRDELGTGAA